IEATGQGNGGRSATGGGNQYSGQKADGGDAGRAAITDTQRRDMGLRMRNEELRNELVKVFLDQPRVAKETFSRLLQEEGVEDTSRYIHIFSHLVIFELLGDPNLQRDLYELS